MREDVPTWNEVITLRLSEIAGRVESWGMAVSGLLLAVLVIGIVASVHFW
ncbi:MAG: hypothetical protein UV94_C0029G0006 [Parcubacteria group bacterium GW2011_GWC1_43_30]|nr:MAG: hypothetical protein UV94_C0029G0006 [Parcubacteria group bacterium GW2011_GWC1_43_30]